MAVIVAICSLMIFGFAAYSIDAGRLWTARRHVVTASDAGALAAAGEYAIGGNGCTVAGTYVGNNHDDASMTACDRTIRSTTAGYVTVAAETEVDYSFARLFGADNKDVDSETTAEWGIPSGVSNLRPFGLCRQASAELDAWLASGANTSTTIRITYGKAQPLACGTVPGNWGVMDFNGGANSNADIQDWTRYGYPGLVSVGDWIPGDTGAYSNSLNSELNYLVSTGEGFALPVFETATGNGSNAQFRIVAFVFVKLIGFRATGPEADRYMDLVFTRGVVSGTCCSETGLDTRVRAVRICDVNTLTPNTSDSRAC